MIMIHACEAREKYVQEFLVPYLIGIGFAKDDVVVYVDRGKGNLEAYLDSYRMLPDEGDWWHLEDDVVPDHRFKTWADGLSYFPGIVCGFGTGQYYSLRDYGYTLDAREMMLSFPCIRIPNEIIKDFLAWLCPRKTRYNRYFKAKKGIDDLFRDYCVETDQRPFNFYPCIVEHVDYLLGGSLVNKERGDVQALVFDDPDAVAEVRRWIA